MIYFDNAAGTPVFPDIRQKYDEILDRLYANSGATHKMGFQVNTQIRICEERLLGVLGLKESDVTVIWTSGGTESNNLAITGYCRSFTSINQFSIVSSHAEHASVYTPIKSLEKQKANVAWIKINPEGTLDLDHFSDSLNENTDLVSCCLIQNETGVIQNLEGIREIMDQKSPQAKLHVDASQAFLKVTIPWHSARIDFLTLSSHKIHGPSGVGVLIVRNQGRNLKPIIEGGGQQGNLRSGTLNASGIFAFYLATNKFISVQQELWRKINNLNKKLRSLLHSLTEKTGKNVHVCINSPRNASPYILNFSLLDYQGAVIMRMLGEYDIIVGTGSACSAETALPSRVLKAMGLSDSQAYGAIRVSFGFQNHSDEIDTFISALQSTLLNY